MENGVLDGVVKDFSEEGNLISIVFYNNGEKVGKAEYFYPDGSLMEVQVFRDGGKVAYFKKYDKNGGTKFEALLPIIQEEKDTIVLGEDYRFTVQPSLPLRDNYRYFVAKGENYKDSIGASKVVDDKFFFSITPDKIGTHSIQVGIFHEKGVDTLNIHKQSIEKNFFVEEL